MARGRLLTNAERSLKRLENARVKERGYDSEGKGSWGGYSHDELEKARIRQNAEYTKNKEQTRQRNSLDAAMNKSTQQAAHNVWKQGVVERGEKASAKIVAQYEKGLSKPAKTPAKTSTSKTSATTPSSSSGRFDTSGYSAKYAMGMSADGKVRQYKRDGSKASNAAIARYNMAQKKKGGK